MVKYRISKYNPIYRKNDVFIKDTWTSIADIGKIYNNHIFTLNDYLKTENNYLYVINTLLDYYNIEFMNLVDLDLFCTLNEIKKSLSSRNISTFDLNAFQWEQLKHNNALNRKEVNLIVKLILREYIWGILENNIKIEFGYDYYMYINCNYIPECIINDALCKNVYIEKL